MIFSKTQKQKFGTYEGAYSVVTDREIKDSQITLTDHEVEITTRFFNGAIHVGNVKGSGGAAEKSFRLYPSGQHIHLNLVYPKPAKSELRLYLAAGKGQTTTNFLIIQTNPPDVTTSPAVRVMVCIDLVIQKNIVVWQLVFRVLWFHHFCSGSIQPNYSIKRGRPSNYKLQPEEDCNVPRFPMVTT